MRRETGLFANGDIAEVRRIRKYEEIYGMRFCRDDSFSSVTTTSSWKQR